MVLLLVVLLLLLQPTTPTTATIATTTTTTTTTSTTTTTTTTTVPLHYTTLRYRYHCHYNYYYGYQVQGAVCSNTEFAGLPIRRDRRYMIMTLKQICHVSRPLTDMLSEWARKRHSSYTWRGLLMADDAELRSEINWARSRLDDDDRVLCSDHLPPDAPLTGHEFKVSLMTSEAERLRGFVEDHNVQKCVCSLSQDPVFARAASSPEVLHAFVRNLGIQWVVELDRFMSVRECFLGQSFPTSNYALSCCLEGTAEAMPLCSFNVSRLSAMPPLPPRDRYRMSYQCGNTMCISVVGSVFQWMFLHMENSAPALPAEVRVSSALTNGQGGQGESDTGGDTANACRFASFKAARRSVSVYSVESANARDSPAQEDSCTASGNQSSSSSSNIASMSRLEAFAAARKTAKLQIRPNF